MAMGRTTKIVLGVLASLAVAGLCCIGSALLGLSRALPPPEKVAAVDAGDAALVGEWIWSAQGTAALTQPDGAVEPRRAGGQERQLALSEDGRFTDVSSLSLVAPCEIRSKTSLRGKWQASAGVIDLHVESGEVETSDSCDPKPTPVRHVAPTVARSTYELRGAAGTRVLSLTDAKGVQMDLVGAR